MQTSVLNQQESSSRLNTESLLAYELFLMLLQPRFHDTCTPQITNQLPWCIPSDNRQTADVAAQHFDDRFLKNLVRVCDDKVAASDVKHRLVSVSSMFNGAQEIASRNYSDQICRFVQYRDSLPARNPGISLCNQI